MLSERYAFDRRRFCRAMSMAVAASQLGMFGCARSNEAAENSSSCQLSEDQWTK
jgi:hypothetical protein